MRGRIKDEEEESDFIYPMNMEQVQMVKDPSGWKMTPILEIIVGCRNTDEAGNIADDGSEYIEEVYKVLKDKVKVPCIIHSALIDINILPYV